MYFNFIKFDISLDFFRSKWKQLKTINSMIFFTEFDFEIVENQHFILFQNSFPFFHGSKNTKMCAEGLMLLSEPLASLITFFRTSLIKFYHNMQRMSDYFYHITESSE